ncbi:MAG: hypothetical protein WBQ66_17800 [Blastocatellia bacterium]
MMAPKLLIAVPDLLFRSKLQDAARRAGAEIFSAVSSAGVISRSLEYLPDAVVIDLVDERLDPIELIRRLKREPRLAGTRIVGFFPHVQVAVRDAAKAAGCDVVVPRSIVATSLAAILAGAVPAATDES